jgi:hypothetical protein
MADGQPYDDEGRHPEHNSPHPVGTEVDAATGAFIGLGANRVLAGGAFAKNHRTPPGTREREILPWNVNCQWFVVSCRREAVRL